MNWDVILLLFLSVDIIWSAWLYLNRPQPLTPVEFLFHMYDIVEDIKKSIDSSTDDVKGELLENRLDMAKDLVRRLEKLKKELKHPNDE